MAFCERETDSCNQRGLYSIQNEHDACGVGFVAHIKGEKSHHIIEKGLQILVNLDHRGAVGADKLMGDGAGILIQIPDAFYREEMAAQGVTLPPPGEYGVGMIFLPKEHASRLACERELERAVKAEGQVLLGWRDVPVDEQMPMSAVVRDKKPVIRQIFIGRGPDVIVQDALERKLYIIRKTASSAIQSLKLTHSKEYYVPSMSSRTIVYKGLLLAGQVGCYYRDLQDEHCVSALALVHQRFSTNTFPEWSLAHPYRMVAHNGEINTVKGNYNWMCAREGVMSSPVLGRDLKKLYPISFIWQSDTATLDNALELLVAAGYPLAQAVMMMIPEPWEKNEQMEPARRALYEYHAAMLEPWDGPASLVFTDGRQIGATLDRNGLRPSRYMMTDDDLVVMASEAGVLPKIADNKIICKWRLQPGKMLLIDLEQGRLIHDEEIKSTLAHAKPYEQWTKNLRVNLNDLTGEDLAVPAVEASLLEQQKCFGYTVEDLKFMLAPMLINGDDAIGSMGNDAALSVLSNRSKSLFTYFKQMFAQVTNPPIDSIRENIVMSLVSFIGPRPNLLDINQVNPPLRLEVSQPILNFEEMAKLHSIEHQTQAKFKRYVLDITYPLLWGSEGIEAKLASLCAEAVDAIQDGYNIIIISDRRVGQERVAIPALLALSAVHQHLIQENLRTLTGLVVETGAAREVHHFAVLAGYGAEAIHPYLAMKTVVDMAAHMPEKITPDAALYNYIKAIGKGLSKVMGKMGISTYMSYCGAQIFEAVGLEKKLIDKYFANTPSQVGGIGVFEIAQEAIDLHKKAFQSGAFAISLLDSGGDYAWRADGEAHLLRPEVVAKLQHSTRSNNYNTYKEYARAVNHQSSQLLTLRGLMDFKIDSTRAIGLEEVEPAQEIVKRFATGAMSMGSISTEAHTALAIAMNRIGGKSNTGEGGEDPARYLAEFKGQAIKAGTTISDIIGKENIEVDYTLKAGDSLRSRIKQVASGRFGVTAQYLASADQIQIKMAQGAKPGEGGQLPGSKVSPYIGYLRYSVPGVGLISPPPHHDIYSIEDLAQLIHDLKNANRHASISVKLVAETGVGTIAAGVAKAKADHIVISGHDGGTGASPLTSIKNAGSPWEIGLADTQQTLVLNGLRSRVRVQVDGQIKTGRDVVIGALLGADEFGFATIPLVALGCIMMRKCHLNTCPVGVATQDPELRKRFNGKPEYVINYLFFVAEEVREIMAQLGVRRFEDLIGHTELLEQRSDIEHWKAKGLDFSRILYQPHMPKAVKRYHSEAQDHGLEKALDNKLIKKSLPALETGERVQFIETTRNTNRTVGAMLSHEVVKRYLDTGLPDDTIRIQMEGTGGQSFGAFLASGITLYLIGEANDYTGKGLSGGRVVVRPNIDFRGESDQNIIVGNTVLYGATRGEAYFSGIAGERFAVRLSGAKAVVEGTGDHGCEYMTGGIVVVLGQTGRNFAAGMSGGVAYVYDETGDFSSRCNTAMVSLELVKSKAEQELTEPVSCWVRIAQGNEPLSDEELLRKMISDHLKWTGSRKARDILDNWFDRLGKFVKVFPHEYKRALQQLHGRPTGEEDKKSKVSEKITKRPKRSTKSTTMNKDVKSHG